MLNRNFLRIITSSFTKWTTRKLLNIFCFLISMKQTGIWLEHWQSLHTTVRQIRVNYGLIQISGHFTLSNFTISLCAKKWIVVMSSSNRTSTHCLEEETSSRTFKTSLIFISWLCLWWKSKPFFVHTSLSLLTTFKRIKTIYWNYWETNRGETGKGKFCYFIY